MAEPDPPPTNDPNGDALGSLRRRVDAIKKQNEPDSTEPPSNAASLALKFGGEFGAAVLVGAAIGFGIDQFAPTEPFGLVVGLFLGFAAGVTNVMREAQSYSRKHPVDPNAPSIPDDEED